MEDTKSKVESIARKYGYYAEAYMGDYGSHKVPVISFTAMDRSKSPDVRFNVGKFRKKLTGIDRFSINHSAVGSLSVDEEAEFIHNVDLAIQMCREINELDLEDLPEPTTTESTVRSRTADFFDKVSRY